jgi:hypothetical protein
MICFAFAIVVDPFIPFIELNGDGFFIGLHCFSFFGDAGSMMFDSPPCP